MLISKRMKVKISTLCPSILHFVIPARLHLRETVFLVSSATMNLFTSCGQQNGKLLVEYCLAALHSWILESQCKKFPLTLVPLTGTRADHRESGRPISTQLQGGKKGVL
jgi:hypothetical protein